uniref:BTB domain-containing protein n=1 Tax=Strigamia maritima TaxID=126957 RepID=T1JE76_STRMM
MEVPSVKTMKKTEEWIEKQPAKKSELESCTRLRRLEDLSTVKVTKSASPRGLVVSEPTTSTVAFDIPLASFSKNEDAFDFRSALNQARVDKLYGDVYLTCDNVHLPAHKIVLSAKSKYFHEIFSCDTDETCTEVLVLQGVEPVIMEALLDFMYTGEIHWINIPPNKIQRLIMAGVRLSITNFCNYCISKITENLTSHTFRNALDVAEILKNQDMENQIINYVADNLENLWISTDLMLLNEKRIGAVLATASHRSHSHDIVLRSLLAWVKHNVDERVRMLWALMNVVNLPKISATYARFLLEEDPIVKDNVEVRDHIVNLLHMREKEDAKEKEKEREKERERQREKEKEKLRKMQLEKVAIGGRDSKSDESRIRKTINFVDGGLTHGPLIDRDSTKNTTNSTTTSSRALDLYVSKPSAPCLVLVGQDESNKLCICYYNIKVDQWTEAEIIDLNTNLKPGLLYDRNNIFFIGGEDSQQFKVNKCFMHDLGTRETRRLPDLRIPRASPIVFTAGNAIYVAGGTGRYSNSGLSHVEWLESSMGNVWKNGAPMREKRDQTASWTTVRNNKVYVVGGGTNKCEFFSCVSRTWNELPALPVDFKDLPCYLAMADERLFVMKQFNPSKVYFLDQNKGTWKSQVTKGVAPELVSHVTGWSSKIFVVDKALNLSVLDVLTNTWYHVTRLARAITRVKYISIE